MKITSRIVTTCIIFILLYLAIFISAYYRENQDFTCHNSYERGAITSGDKIYYSPVCL